MTLTPPPTGKRAPLPRQSYYEKTFTKDWQRLTRSGRYNMNTLKEVMPLLIANTGPLPPEWRDHELVGDWSGHRECHVGGDFLLIYRFDDDSIILSGPELIRNSLNSRKVIADNLSRLAGRPQPPGTVSVHL